MMISNSYIRELFDEYGIKATDDQVSVVAFDINTTIEESHIPVRSGKCVSDSLPPTAVSKHENCDECLGSGESTDAFGFKCKCRKCEGYGVVKKYK